MFAPAKARPLRGPPRCHWMRNQESAEVLSTFEKFLVRYSLFDSQNVEYRKRNFRISRERISSRKFRGARFRISWLPADREHGYTIDSSRVGDAPGLSLVLSHRRRVWPNRI